MEPWTLRMNHRLTNHPARRLVQAKPPHPQIFMQQRRATLRVERAGAANIGEDTLRRRCAQVKGRIDQKIGVNIQHHHKDWKEILQGVNDWTPDPRQSRSLGVLLLADPSKNLVRQVFMRG